MAKLERVVTGNFDTILNQIHSAILNGSLSASYEDGSEYARSGMRFAVRVYERYSCTGGNRLSMTVTLVGQEGKYMLTAITAGGSQGMFLKFNTLGEESFLDTIRSAVDDL